jgi:hypothetical protein
MGGGEFSAWIGLGEGKRWVDFVVVRRLDGERWGWLNGVGYG